MMCLRIASVMLILSHHSESYSSHSGQISAVEMCLDHKGDIVKQGDRYFPLGTDPCTQCTCLNGKPEMCISVFCSPPENCRQYHAVNDKCCEFVCLDGDFMGHNGIRTFNTTIITRNGDTRNHGSLSTNNLGLRLIASTITSFLILALLLFMIHRLRQRRLLLMIRRLQTRRLEQVNAMTADNGSGMGYFNSRDHYDFGGSFNEPPPPYTFWKPPENYIPPGEAPPPYDDSIGVTILPCYEVNRDANATNNSNQIVNPLTMGMAITNSIATTPMPLSFPHRQTVALSVTRDGYTQLQLPQLPVTTPNNVSSMNASTSPLSPIIDTISSDQCYEHITVVRINGNNGISNNVTNNLNMMSNAMNNNSVNSDSISTSSSSPLSSPSNCSESISSSTSTQSTVRRHDPSDPTVSRL